MNGCARLRFLVLPCLLVLSYALAAEGAILLYEASNVEDAAAVANLEELIIYPELEVTTEWDISTTLPSLEETTTSVVESENDAATEIPLDEGNESTTDSLLENEDATTTTAEPVAAESSSAEPATTEAESTASSIAGSSVDSTTGSSVDSTTGSSAGSSIDSTTSAGSTTGSSIDSTTGSSPDSTTASTGAPSSDSTTASSAGSSSDSTTGSSSDSTTGSSSDSTTASTTETAESASDSTASAAELPTASPFVCEKPGMTPHPSDCHVYYSCQPMLGSTELITSSVRCPEKMAFSADLARCSRDIVTCSDDTFECLTEGTFAHPQSNASYYRCMAGYDGFHKFHVECPLMKTYLPILGKCFIDINKLDSLTQLVQNEVDDEIAVNAEIKLIKKAEKMRAKNEKLKEKMAMKLQKELDKKAAKEARKQAKMALKMEAATSVESAASVSV